jgi:hypothetical protein
MPDVLELTVSAAGSFFALYAPLRQRALSKLEGRFMSRTGAIASGLIYDGGHLFPNEDGCISLLTKEMHVRSGYLQTMQLD